MTYKPRFNSRRRESLWQREQLAAHKAGRGEHPICVHCDLPVTPGQDWDEAHVGAPKTFGGKTTGVGHRLCNRHDNNTVVTPAYAKARRVRRKHLGITGPGLGRHPLPAGRRSGLSKGTDGTVKPRLTLGEKLAALRAKRSFGLQENAP